MTPWVGGGLLLALFTVLLPQAAAQTPIPVPPGFGHYCSMLYPDGTWNFALGQSKFSDPCLSLTTPGSRIARAGLWDTGVSESAVNVSVGSGENSILIRCDKTAISLKPSLVVDRGVGADFLNNTVAKVNGLKNCVVTVAPTALPIFGRPWGTTAGQPTPDADVNKVFVTGENFDNNFFQWHVTDFGQDLDQKGNVAVAFDRFGRQQLRPGSNAECTAGGQPPGCFVPSRTGSDAECATRGQPPGCVYTQTFEPAYDWSMPGGKPLVAVAEGQVLWAGKRDISGAGCTFTDKFQKEMYVQHLVANSASDTYAEKFVTIYFHLGKFLGVEGAPTETPLAIGTELKAGDQLGTVGTTGCSGGTHLDFRVVRLTNLTGGRSFTFKVQLPTGSSSSPVPTANSEFAASQEGYGSNGLAGHIDPFGWAAPKGMDPWAWRSIGQPNPGGVPFPSGVTEYGAFSINLWKFRRAPPGYWTDFVPVFDTGDPGNGIGGYDLKSVNDQVFPFDFDSSGKLDHLVLYRPGTGAIFILENKKGKFKAVYKQSAPGNGIGGYDLKSADDRIFAFDYDHSGKFDHLVLYRPGTGTIWILQHKNGKFTPVFQQANGIGGYDLKSTDDRVFAFDYDHSGRLDHLVLYRPGTGAIFIVRHNQNGSFTPVYQQPAPGNGIGGYDLKSTDDHVFAFDYNGRGKADHLALYRPGTGAIFILENNNGTFQPVYQQGAPGDGIGGYDLKSTSDQVIAFDYDSDARPDHLVLYRPGTGAIWILQNNGDQTFDWVYQPRSAAPAVNGIGGYDLLSDRDRVFPFDFDSSGNSDHLVLYRPGTGTIWILKHENPG